MKTGRDKGMQTYRIEETANGWALFKARSRRPTLEAPTQEALVKLAAPLLAEGASVRILKNGGTLRELRF